MGLLDPLIDKLADKITFGIQQSEMQQQIDIRNYYRVGLQKRPLKVKAGGYDDNVIINLSGLIVDRWVSWLFGKDITFDLPGEEGSTEQTYIDEVWKGNKKQILLHKVGVNGSVAGTAYLKIIPGDSPRLVAVDPRFVTVETLPDDIETVTAYVIQYTVKENGKDVTYKEAHEKRDGNGNESDSWYVNKFRQASGKRWELISSEPVGQDFPLMIHCQNLPCTDSVYGIPDLDENVIRMQNQVNFVASNINKIIRLHAAPQPWGRGIGEIKKVEWGPDKYIDVGQNGELHNLEMQSDLTSSQVYLQYLIKQLYATTRTIDLDSLADKLGQLTNFGLHVLFQDTLTKLETKRSLYGEMLVEVNRRLLVLSGKGMDGGAIEWPDVVPSNETDEIAALEADKRLGIVSNETIAMKRGYDYEQEQEKIANDKAGETNIGEMILKGFNRGQ